MAEILPKFDRAFLSTLVRGAEKIFDNAEKLYFEAEILANAGATARALCLHQISLEECSKVEEIGAWATSLLTGLAVDQNRVLAAFRRHSSKNKNNAYMLEGSRAEKDAKERGDWKTALEAFKNFQIKFHQASNNTKNASLYVDWKDGEFVSPSEQVTLEMLTAIIERNRNFLGYAYNSLKMLRRLDKSLDDLQDLLIKFVVQVERIRAEKPDGPMTAINELFENFLDAWLERLNSTSG